MNVYFIDENGTPGIIQNDLTIESEKPVHKKIRQFVKAEKRAHEDPVTLSTLPSGFLIVFYVETPVKRVEPVTTTY